MSNRAAPAVAAALLVVIGACSTGADPPTTTPSVTTAPQPTVVTPGATAPATTATTPVPGETTVPPGVPMTEQEAYQVVFGFDPATGDPAVLAGALDVTGPRPAFPLAGFLEHGSIGVQEVVFDSLGSGSAWSVPMLIAMREYGMPSGSLDAPKLWPSDLRMRLAATLHESAGSLYQEKAEMMIELNRLLVTREVERCVAEGCEWAGEWYFAPEAVTSPVGEIRDAMVFDGTVTVISDTGAGDIAPIVVSRFDGWVPVEGFLAERPVFGLADGTDIAFDGAVITSPQIRLIGWAEEGTTIHVGDASACVDAGWWELTVPTDDSGTIEIKATKGAEVRSITLGYTPLPGGDRIFGYLIAPEMDEGRVSMVVDRAEWFFGEAATAAARQDGVIGPDDVIENDFYIRNLNPLLRTIPVDDDAGVWLIDGSFGDLDHELIPLGEFVRILEETDDASWYGAAHVSTPYWLTIGPDGFIRQIEQHYLP